MKAKLAWIFAITLSLLAISSTGQSSIKKGKESPRIAKLMSILSPKRCERETIRSFPALRKMLEQPAIHMSPAVISKVITTLRCAEKSHTYHHQILSVIDYSLPSNQKRLWVFDLRENRMLFHTYVAHGITSGTLLSNQFSNKHNSKASSLGIYKTTQAYYGRHGLSLRLAGLEEGFNDHARGRAVVMHSAWYVNEEFIGKYGRPGRSWGCPAISKEMKQPIISAIKENGLLVVYYPGEKWVSHSKYLNCKHFSPMAQTDLLNATLKKPTKERTDILFVEKNHNNKREESEPIVVMSADHYINTFHTKAPLLRMLRCQINDAEYIALSDVEFETLAQSNDEHAFNHVSFVIPEVKKIRGYYKTEMKFVPLGKIKQVNINYDTKKYTVTFDKSPSKQFKTTHRFIRWLGL
ncbi:MAG: murein L,D-transpeptidase catalytic domain family protein [Gammaproteobacteria bacterium]|nr:murein L,D-transpeptidase catalytic domain family protein [Gammaproteobacteria bacterium]MCH9763718.1 murein L,D-transpeptidase catalytic domain family protein [Gammaproteobacteria bacterium]